MQPRSGVAAARQAVVDGGRDDQRQDHGDQQAADDGDGEGLQHLRAGAEGEGQGEACRRPPRWRSSRWGEGGGGRRAASPRGPVAGDSRSHPSRDCDGACARNFWSASSSRMPFLATMPMTMMSPMKVATLKVGARDQQRENHAGDGEDGGGEDGDGRGEVAELREEDAEDQDQGEEENL